MTFSFLLLGAFVFFKEATKIKEFDIEGINKTTINNHK